MKVILNGDVIAPGAAEASKILQLLAHASSGRHVVQFDPPNSITACLAAFAPDFRATYTHSLALATRRAASFPANAPTIRIDVTSEPKWEDPIAVLPLDDALAVLDEPLGVLVEDEGNDWSFLLGVMRPSERQRMLDAVRKRWATPIHGGGANLTYALEGRLQSPAKKLRTFVVFDSDRRHPRELAPEWVPKPNEACQGYQVEKLTRGNLPHQHWRLARRFIESYMPRSELAKGCSPATPPDAVDAFFRLSQPGRWYFNMKAGFNADASAENIHRCLDIFHSTSTSDAIALTSGFGRKLADHYSFAVSREFNWDVEALAEASVATSDLMRLL